MEQLYLLCFLFFSLTLGLLLLLIFNILTTSLASATKEASSPHHSVVPPGPQRVPIIGNLHQLMGRTLPHRRLAFLSKLHGPITLLKLGRAHHVVISSPSAAEQVLRTSDFCFPSRPQLSASRTLSYNYMNIIHSPYGAYWRQMRKICVVELLTAKRVKSFRSVRRDEVRNLVEGVKKSASMGSVDLSGRLLALANNITFMAVIGKKCREQERLLRVIRKGSELIGGFQVTDYFPELWFVEYLNGLRSRINRVHRELDQLLEGIIRDHENETAVNLDKNLVMSNA